MPVGGGLRKCAICLMSQGLSTFWLQMCSCPLGGAWGGGPGICTIWLMSQKKCSCQVNSQNAMHVAYISIMHCSLPVISLLICCQKEVLKACTCLYSQAARHSGVLPPPPLLGMSTIWLMSQGLSTFWLRTPPPPPLGMSTFWLTSERYAIDIRIAFLFCNCLGILFVPRSASFF